MTGVMRPFCDGRQIHDVAVGMMTFTPDEIAVIRDHFPSS